MKQADLVSIGKDDNRDLNVYAAGGTFSRPGTVAVDQGDEALRRWLQELIFTPMYRWIYTPFFGQRFDMVAQAPDGINVLRDLRAEWRRLMDGDERVDADSANVTIGTDGLYVFSVVSLLTGELITLTATTGG